MSTTPYVLITTKHRGVFFGQLVTREGNLVTLENARCAIRWNTEGGFLELADRGPNEGSKIGPTAPQIELYDVTSIAKCTDEAVTAWQRA